MKWTGHCDYKSMKPYIDIAGKTKSDFLTLIPGSGLNAVRWSSTKCW